MKQKSSIVFTGDVGFDRYMYGKWDDENLLSPDVIGFLHSADHVVTNVEGPIANAEQNTTTSGVQQLLHTIDPAAVKVLKNMNADIWNICNNHIMDAGEYGIKATLEEAERQGVQTIGAGMNIHEARKPVIINEAGGIGLFGVGYQRACRKADEEKAGCYSWSDLDEIQKTINDIKKKCRWCVVVAHAGEEFTPLPSPYTRERYHLYLEMGADIVVGHHPHVPMNYETVGDKIIFYSLGNFIFDTDYQRSQFNTEKGLLVKINFTEDSFTYEPMGLEIIRGSEHIVKADLPDIFVDVDEEEFNLLSPLSAKMHIAATKRQMAYLKPEEFKDATEEKWKAHFSEELRTGRVPGETLDFFILCPLAEKAETGEWKKSKLEDVKKYILEQI
jgi:poly-gamma-glutamate synthesis protein (capsule biosynthesis protein)